MEAGLQWQVELFRPEYAEPVTRLFLSVYGRGYPIPTYIDPDALTRENGRGSIISCVARTPRGDVVGFEALYNSAPFSGIYETGAGVVHSFYRGGKGIFTEMTAFLQEVGQREFGVEGVYGESVCNHVFTQKMCHSLGWVTHAVEVDLMPASAYVKEASASGRVASLLDFKTLRKKRHRAYIPGVYVNQLRFMYAGLDDERDLSLSESRFPPDSRTHVEARHFDFAQVMRLAVRKAGADFASSFDREERQARDKGVTVIQAWLNLSEPWVGAAVDVLRGKGYFLGGLLPRWFDADGLLLTRVFHRPHWEGMQVQFERAGKIVQMAREDWERTQ
ncbi:MAG: hypothetical protein AB1512_30950 [Thermodesulfobacteriota bacterium]